MAQRETIMSAHQVSAVVALKIIRGEAAHTGKKDPGWLELIQYINRWMEHHGQA